jgi:putative membrane protein
LLFHYTVGMFALFIGLTLGGAPLLFKAIRPLRVDVIVAMLAGFAVMLGVVFMKQGSGFPHNTGMDVVSGVVGATTMVLPGISGSYMLLVMDQYDRVVGSVRDLKDGIKAGDLAALKAALMVVIPVGIGAIIGIIALTNILKVLLRRFHRPTVGVLLGVLLGSVVGLWPFTQSVGEKALADRSVAEIRAYAARWSIPGVDEIRGADAATEQEALIAHVTDHAVWSKRTNPPITSGDAGVAIAMALVGFGATSALSRLGRA